MRHERRRGVVGTTEDMTRPNGCPGTRATLNQAEWSLPAAFICETVSERPHVVSNGGPFRATYDTNVLDRQYREEQILVGFWKDTISVERLTVLMAAAEFMFTS